MLQGEIHYGPGPETSNVPPELLAVKPTYLDYLEQAVDGGTGAACLIAGTRRASQ